ncbi:lipopolysaccharide biosynthesis protein [Arenimonas alkanexedens]
MRLARNLVAGLAGSAWIAIVGLAATPFYLALLGLEAYGLVGFFMTLQALMSLLDLGLSPTMNRDVARGLAENNAARPRRLLHSLGILYWLVAIGIAAAVALSAPWLAEHWLRAQSIPPEKLQTPLVLMGLAIAARWPAGLYMAAANGAQRLVLTSTIAATYATVSAVGGVLLLTFHEATLEVYFAWQALAALAYTLAMQQGAWSALRGRDGAKFSPGDVIRVWRFSAVMGLIAVTSVLLTQLDKTLLSRMLGLDEFGRYMIASMVAGSLYLLVTPVFNAIYPRFSGLVASGDEARLLGLYRLGTRFLATLVFPVALVLVVFAEPVVATWTRDAGLAKAVAPMVSLLAAGTALHTMMFFPYALQLASGLPRLSLLVNLVMIVLLVPLTIALTLVFAGLGAAAAWLCLHVFYLFFGTWVTHRRLLRGAARGWLTRDLGLPLAISVAVAILGWSAGLQADAAWPAWALAMWALAAGACVLGSPALRASARELAGFGRTIGVDD